MYTSCSKASALWATFLPQVVLLVLTTFNAIQIDSYSVTTRMPQTTLHHCSGFFSFPACSAGKV